jgi:aryl-alcohol dehydrogenase-like predicted oxidoreductase
MRERTLGTPGPRVGAVGLGGMYLSISGRPSEAQALRTIHAALDAGVTLIDTADAYCLDDTDFNHNERLIGKAVADRRDRVMVATKCGCARPGGAWTVDARPDRLIECAHASLRALGTESLDLLQLHAPDARVPFEDSVGALARLQQVGKTRHVGLSNVSVAQIEAARRIVPIVSVQNRWSPFDRRPEKDGVLDYCTRHGLAFLLFRSGASGEGLKGV